MFGSLLNQAASRSRSLPSLWLHHNRRLRRHPSPFAYAEIVTAARTPTAPQRLLSWRGSSSALTTRTGAAATAFLIVAAVTVAGDGARSKAAAPAPPAAMTLSEELASPQGLSHPLLLVPTLQAVRRVLRLGATVALVAWDYQCAEWVDWYYSTAEAGDIGDDNEAQYWERQVEKRRQALNEAQGEYMVPYTPLPGGLDAGAIRVLKERQKDAMHRAAQELAEAEDRLASSTSTEGSTGRSSGEVHRRAAQRLLGLCQANRGVYIKGAYQCYAKPANSTLMQTQEVNEVSLLPLLSTISSLLQYMPRYTNWCRLYAVGQHLANLDYLLPQEYIETLSVLFDQNPHTPYADIREVIKEDLGKYPEDLFHDFDPEPIASASLAQVHVAYDRQTRHKLAVKVQHRGLRETSVGDIAALVAVVRLAERVFPTTFTLGWLADEIAPQLPKELDFLREGRNAERAARNLRPTGLDCVVPRILWKHSAPRVLTMEYEDGCKASDATALKRLGLDKRDVARLISSVFSSQVFLSRFVHCDPHPANVLVRAKPNGKPQLVLLDHGLYREIDPDFRRCYAELWKGLMLADLAGIREACQGLGVGQAYPLFSAVLTARPFDEVVERSRRRGGGSLLRSAAHRLPSRGMAAAAEARLGSRADQAVIRGYAQRYLLDIVDLLGTVPRQTLLLLKMNDCLRHIDLSLGSPTNTLVISGRYAALSLYLDTLQAGGSLVQRLGAWWSYVHVLARIRLHDAAVWWSELLQKTVTA